MCFIVDQTLARPLAPLVISLRIGLRSDVALYGKFAEKDDNAMEQKPKKTAKKLNRRCISQKRQERRNRTTKSKHAIVRMETPQPLQTLTFLHDDQISGFSTRSPPEPDIRRRPKRDFHMRYPSTQNEKCN